MKTSDNNKIKKALKMMKDAQELMRQVAYSNDSIKYSSNWNAYQNAIELSINIIDEDYLNS